jgi:hypothetical protein
MPRTLCLAAALLRAPAIAATVAGYLLPGDVHAAPGEQLSGDDELELVSGAVRRGTLVSEVPNDEVSIIVLGSSEARSFPWSEVAEIRRGKYAPTETTDDPDGADSAAPPYVDAATPTAEPPQEDPSGTHVHIEVDESRVRPVSLFRITGEGVASGSGGTASATFFEEACTDPCNRRVPAGEFFIAGQGVSHSKRFRLRDGGSTKIHVRPGSRGLRFAGIMFVGLGGMTLGSGVMVLGLSADAASEDSAAKLRRIGGIMMGAGAVPLVAGIPMIIRGKTRVEVGPGRVSF